MILLFQVPERITILESLGLFGGGGEECSGFIPGRAQALYGVLGMEDALEPFE